RAQPAGRGASDRARRSGRRRRPWPRARGARAAALPVLEPVGGARGAEGPRGTEPMTTAGTAAQPLAPPPPGRDPLQPALDPLPILKGFANLRRLTGTYPAGHPMIAQKLRELE